VTKRIDWEVSIQWLAKQCRFFVSGVSPVYEAGVTQFARSLLTWDATSFYGTLVETGEEDQRPGFFLSAAHAMQVFSRTDYNSQLTLVWPDWIESLRYTAIFIRDAFEHKQFMPDYQAWRNGQMSWRSIKPVASEAEHATTTLVPWADAWLNAALTELETVNSTTAVAMESLRANALRLPITNQHSELAEVWQTDEESLWLETISWGDWAHPYRIGIRLTEPASDEAWTVHIVLQARANPELIVVPSLEEIPETWDGAADVVSAHTTRILRICPDLAETVDEEEPASRCLKSNLKTAEAWIFLTETAERLVEAGYLVFLPGWFTAARRASPRLGVRVSGGAASANQDEGAQFGLASTLKFDWHVALGDTQLSESEYERIVKEKQQLVQVRGRWITLDHTLTKATLQTMRRRRKRGMSLLDVLQLHFGGTVNAEQTEESGESLEADSHLHAEVKVDLDADIDLVMDEQLLAVMERLNHVGKLQVSAQPAGFHGTLRPYQALGTAWLLFLRNLGLGACLADDMGLGKTIQFIAYVLQSRLGNVASDNRGALQQPALQPLLLVCPTSVLGNWQKEFERFAPDLRIHVHYGKARLHGEDFSSICRQADVVLTSYTLVNLDLEDVTQIDWHTLCLDEAQNIKNPYTKQSVAIRSVQATHRIAMTGTPIENRLSELWSIMDFLNPGYLGSLGKFQERFVRPIERGADDNLSQSLRGLVQPLLLRRVKTDPAIELDLPPKTEQKVFVPLTAEQAGLYEAVLSDMLAKVDTLPPMQRRGIILAALTKLKQICNHPALYIKEVGLGRRWQARSTKLDRLVEMLEEVRAEGDSCLVFTQFAQTGMMLQTVLAEALDEPVRFLHGGTPKASRDEMVDEFQQTPGVFVLSLKAGGVGLNLTAANHVFHFDRWWNPAVENQATDRAFRIGQTRHVQVHKFVSLGTLEERIDTMLEKKLAQSEHIVGASEQWITELDTAQIRDLFALRREWVEA